jgi:HEAT repeat protein
MIDQLIRRLGSDDFKEREQAQRALVALGGDALKPLQEELKNSDAEIAKRAKVCIQEIERNQAIARYIADLKSQDTNARLRATKGLADYKEHSKPAIPALIKALDDASPSLREQAVVALGSIGPDAEAAVPKLIALVKDKNQSVGLRLSAAKALGEVGPESANSVLTLIRMCHENEDKRIQAGAFAALQALYPLDLKLLPSLRTALLEDPDPCVRAAAAAHLGEMAVKASLEEEMFIRNQIETLKDRHPQEAVRLVRRLNRARPVPREVVPAIVQSLQDQDPRVRANAAVALFMIRSEAKEAVPGLIKALDDVNNHVRGRAATALGAYGAEARAAVPKLIDIAKDTRIVEDNNPEYAPLRSCAILAFKGIGPAAQVAVPTLFELLEKGDPPYVRVDSARALLAISRNDQRLIPGLRKLLKEEKDLRVRSSAAAFLGRIGGKANVAIPDLIEALNVKIDRNDKDAYFGYNLKRNAACTLGLFGAEAKAAVPQLARLLQDPAIRSEQRQLVEELLKALDQIGTVPNELVPLLKQLAQDRQYHRLVENGLFDRLLSKIK